MRELKGHFDPDELAAVDTVLYRVLKTLKGTDTLADQKLVEIFGAPWIKATDAVNLLDYSHFPILFVSPFNSLAEPAVAKYTNQFSLYITARFEMPVGTPLAENNPTVASLGRHIHSLFEQGGNKTLQTSWNSQTIGLVTRSTPGPQQFEFQEGTSKGRFIVNHILQRDFEANLDPETMRIRNQIIAEQAP